MPVNNKVYSALHPALLSMVLLIFLTETILVYISEAVGILLVVVSAVVIYALISILNLSERTVNAIEDISLLLIYILLVSVLPWFFFRQELLVPAIYSMVLALCFWRVRSRNLSLESLGLAQLKIKDCPIGILLGIPMGVTEYFVLKPAAATPTFDIMYFLQTILYMLVFVGLGEELLFRALIQKSVISVMGVIPGVFWSGLIFAIMHTVWRSVPEIFFTLGAGLLIGTLYQKTGRLIGPIFLHATNNVLLLAVMPFLL
jgi:membrane protease YdiL (CAAX protease family)